LRAAPATVTGANFLASECLGLGTASQTTSRRQDHPVPLRRNIGTTLQEERHRQLTMEMTKIDEKCHNIKGILTRGLSNPARIISQGSSLKNGFHAGLALISDQLNDL
jgi:hypothetical protein